MDYFSFVYSFTRYIPVSSSFSFLLIINFYLDEQEGEINFILVFLYFIAFKFIEIHTTLNIIKVFMSKNS